MNEQNGQELQDEIIIEKIILIRGIKVMIDSDLAMLYGVTTKRLNEQVKRNSARFPSDFMFQLTTEEKEEVVAKCDHLKSLKFSPYLPSVFTEHGAVMLTSVLNSKRAIAVNIQIVRVFIKLRNILESHKEILNKLDKLQRDNIEQYRKILLIFEYLNKLEKTRESERSYKERKRIGFRRSEEK
jgi:hypothetical protein